MSTFDILELLGDCLSHVRMDTLVYAHPLITFDTLTKSGMMDVTSRRWLIKPIASADIGAVYGYLQITYLQWNAFGSKPFTGNVYEVKTPRAINLGIHAQIEQLLNTDLHDDWYMDSIPHE